MQLGIFAKTFPTLNAADTFEAVRKSGFACTQFNMACVGLPSMPDEISASTISEISRASMESGVAIAAISATYNMIHPDVALRKRGMMRLETILKNANAMGTNLVTLCTGTCDPDDQWRFHPENKSEQSWKILTTEMSAALKLADQYEVDLGIEPELANVINSADAAHQLINEMKSNRLRIILDPANLFEVSENEQREIIIAHAIEQLGPHIAMAHIKDRDANGQVVAAGKGIIDFSKFIKMLKTIDFDCPLVTHGLIATEAPAVAKYFKQLITS
jgi:sugar phosphate isomerase/epimerase